MFLIYISVATDYGLLKNTFLKEVEASTWKQYASDSLRYSPHLERDETIISFLKKKIQKCHYKKKAKEEN